MRKMLFGAVLLISCLVGVQSAHAEYFGLINGRAGDLRDMPNISIDGGFMTGDYGASSYDLIGVRLNYRVIPGLLAYADLGKSDISRFYDGTNIGFGVFYQLQDLIPGLDVALKGSYHKVDLGGFAYSEDLDAFSFELITSSKEPIAANGLSWYANAGLHRLGSSRVGTATELGIGAGMFLPLGPGEVFFGADFIDEILFGAGFRFHIR